MDRIIISELEVHCHVGVTAEERAAAQRLLLSLEIGHDFHLAASRDDLAQTIDYHAVCQQLLTFGNGRQWALIETLAADIAALVIDQFGPQTVTVEVRKFIIPEARYVAVQLTRP